MTLSGPGSCWASNTSRSSWTMAWSSSSGPLSGGPRRAGRSSLIRGSSRRGGARQTANCRRVGPYARSLCASRSRRGAAGRRGLDRPPAPWSGGRQREGPGHESARATVRLKSGATAESAALYFSSSSRPSAAPVLCMTLRRNSYWVLTSRSAISIAASTISRRRDGRSPCGNAGNASSTTSTNLRTASIAARDPDSSDLSTSSESSEVRSNRIVGDARFPRRGGLPSDER